MLMQDDRDRYMAEIIEQADGSAGYITAFIDTNESRCPWTMELMNCGYAIGNVAYFYYKQQFRRVRPSTLCPGLAPPFGPPPIRRLPADIPSSVISSRFCSWRYRRFDSATACSPLHTTDRRESGNGNRPLSGRDDFARQPRRRHLECVDGARTERGRSGPVSAGVSCAEGDDFASQPRSCYRKRVECARAQRRRSGPVSADPWRVRRRAAGEHRTTTYHLLRATRQLDGQQL